MPPCERNHIPEARKSLEWHERSVMRFTKIACSALALVAAAVIPCSAAPFVLFPATGELISPDRRFVVRDAAREGAATDFVGTFHSLWLTDLATGRSRKLCDYLGVAAAAWVGDDFLLVTQYSGKKSARALLVSAKSDESVMLDAPTLAAMAPADLRAALHDNDHVFVEASHLDAGTFYIHVWGYGHHDPSGFSRECTYALIGGAVSCPEASHSKP